MTSIRCTPRPQDDAVRQLYAELQNSLHATTRDAMTPGLTAATKEASEYPLENGLSEFDQVLSQKNAVNPFPSYSFHSFSFFHSPPPKRDVVLPLRLQPYPHQFVGCYPDSSAPNLSVASLIRILGLQRLHTYLILFFFPISYSRWSHPTPPKCIP